MNITNKSIKIKDYQVLTDIGFVDINYIIKTIPLKKYIVYFTSGKIIECADNHAFMDIEYDTILTKNLKEGDLIISKNGFDEVFDIIETEEIEEMYDLNLDNHHLYYSNNILSHNSNTMINWASRQVLHGHNVVLLTLEMSQDMTAQRFDSIYSRLDINRMYHGEMKTQLARTLSEIKQTENRAKLFIKQYPTGGSSVRDFRIYLRELIIRDIKPSIIYVDYINLMKSAFKKTDDLYMSGKTVAEELRALAFEFALPVISVSQLNREGSFVGFEELGFNYIAESHGIPAVADFMGIFGINQDERIYKCELHNKIVKNRLGGRVEEIWKCFYDDRSLRMYDETELDEWISEVERDLAPPPREASSRRGR